jgi:hypothetical protein
MLVIDFDSNATRETREAVKEQALRSPLVQGVFVDIDPKSIGPNLKAAQQAVGAGR